MKKFSIAVLSLILSCCFACLLSACVHDDGNKEEDKTYETGAVFQVRELGYTPSEDRSFSDKNALKSYIGDNFSDDCYYCVFEDGEGYEVFDNMGAQSSVYLCNIDLYLNSGECLIVYDIYFNAHTQQYSLEAAMPMTTNSQTSIELKFGADKNYVLKANVIPRNAENANLELNVPVRKTLNADETEYFKLTTGASVPLNLTVSGSDDLKVGLYVDGKVNIVGGLLSGKQVKASYFIEADREYYLAIHSYVGNCVVDIELKNVDALQLENEKECQIADKEYFTFSPQISSEIIFGTESQGSFGVELYDENNVFIARTQNADNFSSFVERGKKYIVLVTNYAHTDSQVKIFTRLHPVPLKFGSQGIYQTAGENCYCFTPKITAEYTISLTGNEFAVYGSDWQRKEAVNGRFALSADSVYYLLIAGSVKQFTVEIDLYYSTDTEGVIPEEGEIVVKLVPSATATYNIDGAESATWFDEYLNGAGTFLTEGRTYFVKIQGTAGDGYAIAINKVYTKISLERLVNLFEGAYMFTAESAGDYTITFYSSHTVGFTLYNSDGVTIKEYSGGSGEISLSLQADEYTFDLSVSETTSAGVIIQKSDN